MLTDWQRIQAILKHYRLSKNGLGVSIGDKNGMRFTYIEKGRNNISDKMVNDIVSVYPEISKRWLLTGEGEMFSNKQNLTIVSEPEAEYKKTAPLDEDAVVDYLIKNTDALMNNPTFKLWRAFIKAEAKNELLMELRSSS